VLDPTGMGVQLQGRARDESVPNVTGVRAEFVQVADYDPAMNVVLRPSFAA